MKRLQFGPLPVCASSTHRERRYLVVPGLRSSRIYVFDTKADRRKPKLVVSFATPEHVDHFARHLGHPYRWLANPARRSYHAFDLGRAGPRDIFTPRSIGYGIKQLMRGHLWRPQQRDLAQLGGDFVIARGGEMVFAHRSRTSDDRPSLRDLLAALRSAAS